MGTAGIVGPINSYITLTSADAMASFGTEALSPVMAILSIVVMQIVLPLVVTYAIYAVLRKWGWIKDGDMVLNSPKGSR